MTKPSTDWQRGLQHFNGVLFLPSSSTDGAGKGLGTAWTTGVGTVSHPTPTAGFANQLKRTKYAQVITTTNQELGPRLSAASDYQFWLGNAVNLGGWYMSVIFTIEAWQADTGRLFVGMSASANPICISDTIPNNTMGIWHATTDAQDVLSYIAKDNAGTLNTQGLTVNTGAVSPVVNAPGILATGVTLLLEIWNYPNSMNDANTNIRLSKANTSTNQFDKVVWNVKGDMILSNGTFMAPQVQMSNGTADTTAGHYAISVANIYVAPYSGEQD